MALRSFPWRLSRALLAAPLALSASLPLLASESEEQAILQELRVLREELRALRSEAAPDPELQALQYELEQQENLLERWFPPPEAPRAEILTTPLRRPSPSSQIPGRVDVVDAQDLRRRGSPQRLRDQLGNRAGVQVSSNGSYGGVTAIRLRGTRPQDTRLLQDGLPLIDPSSIAGDVNTARVATAGVDRYEISLGGQSGVYGSGAIAGVIDMQTLRPSEEAKTQLRVQAGSMHTYGVELLSRGPISQDWGYALTLSGLRSRGISATYEQPNPANPIPELPAWGTPYTRALSWQRQWQRNFRYNPRSANPIPYDLRTATIAPGNHDNHEADGFQQLSLRGRVQWTPSEDVLFYVAAEGGYTAIAFDSFSSIDWSVNADDAESRERNTSQRYSAGMQMDLSDDLRLSFDALLSHMGREYPHEQHITGGDYRFSGQVLYAQAQLSWQVNELFTWDIGLDVERQRASLYRGDNSYAVADTLDYVVNGRWAFGFPPTPPVLAQIRNVIDPWGSEISYDVLLHAQNQQPRVYHVAHAGLWSSLVFENESCHLALTARHDRHQREGDASTFRAAGSWWLWDQRLRAHASAATGFRAPSLYQLYSTWGNEGLKAERSISYDAGLELHLLQGLQLNATWYSTRYRELIDFDFAEGYINAASNARVEGMEYRLNINPEDQPWRISAYWNPQRATQEAEPGIRQALRRIPRRLAGIEAGWEWPSQWITLGARYVGSRNEGHEAININGITIPLPIDAPAYTVLYAAAGWQINRTWELSVRAENLGNEDYEEVPGYTTLRPSAWLQVQATF